jgi:DNA-binding NarL/FixJ family response regulator
MPRIALADDCPFTLAGLKYKLASHPEFKVTWATVDPRKTVQYLAAQSVEVLVLEILIGGLAAQGLRLLEKVRSEFPAVRAFVFTSCGDEDIPVVCFKLGVAGFLRKHTAEDQLIPALRQVASGWKHISIDCLDRMFMCCWGGLSLSVRETEVLDALAAGKSNKEITEMLSISMQAVSTYRRRGLEKLGLKSLPEYIHFTQRKAGLQDFDNFDHSFITAL